MKEDTKKSVFEFTWVLSFPPSEILLGANRPLCNLQLAGRHCPLPPPPAENHNIFYELTDTFSYYLSVFLGYIPFSKDCVYLTCKQAGFGVIQQTWLEAWIGLMLCALDSRSPKMRLVALQQ